MLTLKLAESGIFTVMCFLPQRESGEYEERLCGKSSLETK